MIIHSRRNFDKNGILILDKKICSNMLRMKQLAPLVALESTFSMLIFSSSCTSSPANLYHEFDLTFNNIDFM